MHRHRGWCYWMCGKWVAGDSRRYADIFVRVGERVMLDLGLAGLVQKFEDEFGKAWTRKLLGLVGFTTALICIAAAWAILAPAISACLRLYLDLDPTLRSAAVVFCFIIILGLPSILSLIIDAIESRRHIRKVRDLLDESATATTESRILASKVGNICLRALDLAERVSASDAEAHQEILATKKELEDFLDGMTAPAPDTSDADRRTTATKHPRS